MDEKLLRAQYKFLGHEGLGFTEFRLLDLKSGGSEVKAKAFAKNENEFVQVAQELNEKASNGAHLFVGLNPRLDPTAKSSVGNISYCNVLMLDIDPIRPKGVASTDEQHKEAIALGYKVSLDLPNSILVDSGSGCHVYVPIHPTHINGNAEIVTENLKSFSDATRKKYTSHTLRIDSVYDLPRVTRVWGSTNYKSNRPVTPIDFSETKEYPRFEMSLDKVTDTSKQVPLSLPEERFTQLVKIHPGLSKMMKGEGDFPSRSESDYAFIAYLAKAHFSLDAIKSLATRNPTGRGNELSAKDVERIVSKIQSDSSISKSFIHSASVYTASLENRKPGYSTGFDRLDDMLVGLQKGRLYVLAARTNEGKTSFACNVALNLVNKDVVVLYYPTELGYEPLFDKVYAQTSEIPLKAFQFGNFTAKEKEKIKEATNTLTTKPFIVHEDFALTLETIRKRTIEICPQVVIIDFIGAMKYAEGGTPQEIARNVRGIKELAEELKIPIILAAQFNRGAINAEVSMQYIKGSGAIEEFADVVMALSNVNKNVYPRVVDLYILKNRYAEIGKVRLDFYSTLGKFIEHKGE